MRIASLPLVTLWFALASGAGCSSSTAAPSGSASPAADAGASSEVEASDPQTKFPADHPATPRVVSQGGRVLEAPKIVPVFFPDDPARAELEAFLQQLATSSYWTEISKEYGVGSLTIAPSVVASAKPAATVSDADIPTWLESEATAQHWPAADRDTMYLLYYPAETTVDVHGKKSCGAFDGYHHDGTGKNGASFVYGVVARCTQGARALDALTVATSHELIETATDPFYYTGPAFGSTDDEHFIWTLLTVGEVSDMCELDAEADARLVGKYMVARSWSNAAAAAGHDPCVPAPAQPYFAAAARLDDDVTLSAGSSEMPTKGVRVAVGEKRVVDVVLYSDAPTDAWTVDARDGSALTGGDKELALTLDKSTGANGDVLHLTIERLRPGPWGGSALVLSSKSGASKHVWLGFVAN